MNSSWHSDLVVDFHLLSRVDFDRCLQLQRRLVYAAESSSVRRIVVLFAEYPRLITVGRRGSRAHIRWTNEQLRRERLPVRWVSRGGGCVLHGPGQLVIHSVVPLTTLGWERREFVERFGEGVVSALKSLGITAERPANSLRLRGRQGWLAVSGLSLRSGVTLQGMFLNVDPDLRPFAYIDAVDPTRLAPGEKPTMSGLVVERRQPVRMPQVRAALIESLADHFVSERYNLHTGHPWLGRPDNNPDQETISRAS